jgi:type VI protein secretion system component Hcp
MKSVSNAALSFWQAAPEGDLSMESVSFGFAKIEIQYMRISADGTAREPINAGWDLALNKKI